MMRATRRRWHLPGLGVGVVLGFACDHCEPPDRPQCSSCDPVVLLRDEGVLAARGWTLPAAAEAACPAGTEIDPRLEPRWTDQECWDLTAFYAVRALDWSNAEDAWREMAGETFACEVSSGTPGCNADNEPVQQIIGPPEISISSSPAIGLILPTDRVGDANAAVIEAGYDPFGDADPVFESMQGTAQPCTAFLVDRQHVLTARHCLPLPCAEALTEPLPPTTVLFDYTETPSEALPVDAAAVVACGPETDYDDRQQDWALVELAEAIDDREPLPLPTANDPLDPCTLVYALAHPLGHPQARVGTTTASEPTSWITHARWDGATFFDTLDVYETMSGAPVFDLENHLVGMHVRGAMYEDDNETIANDSVLCACPDRYGEAIALATIHAELMPYLEL